MQQLTIDQPIPFILPALPEVIVVCGCGGTGSHIAQSLARLLAHLRDTRGISVELVLIDGDTVEQRNVGRQLFAACEIGQNKAQTLAARFSAAFALNIHAIPAMATAELLAVLARGRQGLGLLVGAVDGPAGRIALMKALSSGAWHLWLDSGNHDRSGQVVIGTKVRPQHLQDAFKLGGICTALPAPSLVYPELVATRPVEPVAENQNCAAAMQDNLQSLMINQMMAAIVAEYIAKLFLEGRITTFETVVDLQTLSMRSTPITARTVAPYLAEPRPQKQTKKRKEQVV